MIDCHFHLDENLVGAEGLVASLDAHGMRKAAVMAPMCPDLEWRRVLAVGGPVLRRGLSSREGVFRGAALFLYRNMVKQGGEVDVGGKRYPITPQPDNDPVARAVAAHPDRLWGWIFVNPAGPVDPVEEINRLAGKPGMMGVKAHPFWHAFPTRDLESTARACADRGLPLLLHLGAGEQGDVESLASAFPGVAFLLAHAGVPRPRETCALAGKRNNVFVDLSAASYVDARVARMAVDLAGAEKCLFGSDGPYFHHKNGRYDYSERTAMLNSLGLSPADRERVAEKNFLKMLEFSGG
ncbi:MAG: amidohydrolase family protein [Deltaproteobacteria bacterium]|nr:amidohydrolase family protein [Deltaproteobacteria bacterium]